MAIDIASLKADAVLDCFGLACPMPVFKTANRIRELQPGQVLEVRADDDGVIKDLPAWCRQTGNEFLGYAERDGEYVLYVRKKP